MNIGTFGVGRDGVAPEVKQEPPETPVHHHTSAFIADQSEDASFEDQSDDVDDSGNSTSSPSSQSNGEEILQGGHIGTSEFPFSASLGSTKTRDMIMLYSRSAFRELVKMARCDGPLWKASEEEPNTVKLNLVEYYQEFHPTDPNLENVRKRGQNGQNSLFRFSNTASKETARLNINPTRLAASFMNLNEWSTIFSSIVSRANILAVVSPGNNGTLDEAAYLMTAEFHLPTTLVQSRASYFVRYCRMLNIYSWAIVDVSLESIFPEEVCMYRMRPSGCLIEPIPGRLSKVTIVQHVKEDSTSLHHLYAPIVASGCAFGAKRWMHALSRSLEFTSRYNTPQSIAFNGDGDLCEFQRKGLMRLGERMLRTYFGEVNGSTTSSWRPVPLYVDNPLKLMMSRSRVHVLGDVDADSLAFSTSVFLPFSPSKVFDFLSDSAYKWYIIRLEWEMEEIATLYTADDVRNKIAILRSKIGGKSPYFIQNSFYTTTEAYIVLTRIQPEDIGYILRGNNPDDVLIWPSGFALLPSKLPVHDERGENRTLLTISTRADDEGRTQRQPAPSINELESALLVMSETVRRIERGLATKERAGGRSSGSHSG